jgi:hypothetical protein
MCASIVRDSHAGIYEFIWSYKTESTAPDPKPGDTHQGTHFHRLSERGANRFLEGAYVTDRVRLEDKTVGAGGFHRLVWVSKTLKKGIAFEGETTWGMPKPEAPPIS